MKKLVALVGSAALAVVASASLSLAADHAAVGVAKCKMCHKIEFDSWSKTKHATAKPAAVECETCHGNGGDYWKPTVMKDAKAAQAAGLISKPEKAACLKCHKPAEFKDEMLAKVHDKKKKV